jgi:tight adherence protein C
MFSGLAILSFLLVWITPLLRRRAERRRLMSLPEDAGLQSEDRAPQRSLFVLIGRHLAARYGGDQIRLLLTQAGRRSPNSLSLWYAQRILGIAFGLGLGMVIGSVLPLRMGGLLFGACGALFGMIVPSFLLGRQVRNRQYLVRKALPDVLDLLVVCVESGMALDAAIVRVSQDVLTFCPPMAMDLRLLNLELQASVPRKEAFRRFWMRTGVEEIRSLVAMIIQAEDAGTPVADSLRIHGQALRVKRRQEVSEKAAKLTVKILFPLIFFIFPALLIVLLGPGVMRMMEAFSAL